jgi:hypothetical protein
MRNQPEEVVSAAVAPLHEELKSYADGISVRLPGTMCLISSARVWGYSAHGNVRFWRKADIGIVSLREKPPKVGSAFPPALCYVIPIQPTSGGSL